MNKYKLDKDDMKKIAHYIAQRNAANVSNGEPKRMLEYYLEAYNITMDKLEEYNAKN